MWKPLQRLALLALFAPAVRAAQDESFDSNGVRLRYAITGEGPPLVVLHGFAGNLDTWRQFGTIDALKADFRVIALDLRGHGGSDKPHAPGKYGREMVEDVVRLLDHLEIPEAHVAGYSLGGMLALKLAATHPDRVTSAVVGGFGWYRFKAPGEDLMDEVAASLEAGTGVAPLMRALTPAGEVPPSEAELDPINRMITAQNDVAALAACARALRGLELTEQELLACSVPMVCVIGEKDALRADVERLVAARDDVAAIIVPGGDHGTAALSPLFAGTIREFTEAFEPAGAR